MIYVWVNLTLPLEQNQLTNLQVDNFLIKYYNLQTI